MNNRDSKKRLNNLLGSENTDTRYEFTFYNGKLLEVIAVELKWKKTYV